ncbi:MAG: hypothetical protein ACOYMG_23510, partial [Candidatus Methylumidiphilus sp.]
MRPRISTDFNRIKDAELLLKANAIVAAMTDNPNFPEPWPVQVPSLSTLRDAVASFQAAVQAALTRDTTKILLRDKAWENLVHLLLDLVPYVEMVAKGDVNILMSSGFDLCKERVHTGSTRTSLEAPAGFTVKRSDRDGELIAHVAKLQGAGSYELQIAEGDPTVEDNWHQYAIFTNGS